MSPKQIKELEAETCLKNEAFGCHVYNRRKRGDTIFPRRSSKFIAARRRFAEEHGIGQ